jgi:uncharacterized protein (DUF433 family)
MIKIARRHARIAARPEVMGGKPCVKGPPSVRRSAQIA